MILYTYLAVSTASNACTALNPKLTSPHNMKAIYIKLKSLSYARPLPSTIGAIYKNSSELRSLFTCSIDAQTIVMYIYRLIYQIGTSRTWSNRSSANLAINQRPRFLHLFHTWHCTNLLIWHQSNNFKKCIPWIQIMLPWTHLCLYRWLQKRRQSCFTECVELTNMRHQVFHTNILKEIFKVNPNTLITVLKSTQLDHVL